MNKFLAASAVTLLLAGSTVTAQAAGGNAPLAVLQLTLHGAEPSPPHVWAAPQTITLTAEAPDATAEREVTITTMETAGSPLWLTGIGLADSIDWLTAEVQESPNETKVGETSVFRRYTILLRGRSPSVAESPRFANLQFVTLSPPTKASPAFSVEIRTEPSLRFAPSELVIPISADAIGSIVRSAVLLASDDVASQLRLNPEPLPPWLSAEIIRPDATADAGRPRVAVTIDAAKWKESSSESAYPLTFEAGDHGSSLQLPVRCLPSK